MESDRSTTRTYTANTCELIVSGREPAAVGDRPPAAIDPVDFSLHLDRTEGGEERSILQGQAQQLNQLQQVVSSYIADLVAKFPIPVAIDRVPPTAEDTQQSDIQPAIDIPPHGDASPRSGILKNLPGLRNTLTDRHNSSAQFDERSGVSKMFGLQPQPAARQATPNLEVAATAAAAIPLANAGDRIPYLTGSGDRSLDHDLHLGDLATATSGAVIGLSALQLFDLAIVLDEYANANLSPAERSRSATLNRPLFKANPASSDDLAAAASRWPNIPRSGTELNASPVYYRNRRSRSAFMSGLPWAIAAALAVGVPLAMLDPNSNPLKDAANKLKMPDLAATKKPNSVASTAPGATKTDPSKVPNASEALPTPWQQQPVQPPANTKPIAPSLPTTQADGKLGAAPLPEVLGGKPGQAPSPDPGTPNRKSESTTNPLSTNPLPPNFNSSGSPATTTAPKPGVKTTSVTPTTKSVGTAKQTPLQIGQVPIDAPSPGKISISKQPALLPPTDPSTSVPAAPVKPVPFNQPGVDESGRIDPFDRPTTTKKPDRTTKPAVATKPKTKPGKSQPSPLNPSPNDPFAPVPKNPNLIDPNESSNKEIKESAEPQVQPIVPDRPLQSNNGGTDAAETNPTLQEAKRYFQGKWKAAPTQPNALQYVLQVNKNGTVKSVSPQGEAATTYLQQSKLIKPGQKLAGGSSDQKIRVLLQPDGGVDTFIEP
ncbi:DUF4335 domain-containing protein [Chamaesiphon sp. VAR_69_metabat_338]|uniref:DUF4335 domain-containing protein n=1 Tax=Chamaesiphon sp. VAR_69_metabat_338 TaxID=2964704 RepID=UPI00286D8D8D|nr:DUF4335 domain-containing protein [Chamaesiphon sp. VAR_69_metabat_338]